LSQDQAGLHQEVKAAVETALRDLGRVTVPSGGMSWCVSPECIQSVTKDSGAEEVVLISGARIASSPPAWHAQVEIWAGGARRALKQVDCGDCAGADLVALLRGTVKVLVGSPNAGATPEQKVLVVEAMELPPEMEAFHRKIAASVEAAVNRVGRTPVRSAASKTPCVTEACLRALAETAKADQVLLVAGGRNDLQGWSVGVELRDANGKVLAVRPGGCELCSGPDMVAAAGITAEGVLNAKAQADTSPPAAPLIPKAAPPKGPDQTLVVRDGVILGAGAALIAGGLYLWHRDGEGTHCGSTPDGSVCAQTFHTKRIAVPLIAAGVLGLAVGGPLLYIDIGAVNSDRGGMKAAFGYSGRF